MRERVGRQDGRRGSATGRSARWARRSGALTAGLLAAVVAGGALAPGTASAAPTSAQVDAAAQAKSDAKKQVAAITTQLEAAEAAATQAHADAQIALQDYEDAQQDYTDAQTDATKAAAAASAADASLAEGKAQVVAFARESYMAGTTDPGMTALLTAGGPAELLERAALLEAAGQNRVDVVAQLTVLESKAADADAAAKAKVTEAAELKTHAAALLTSAQAQETSAQTQAAELSTEQTDSEAALVTAERTLYGLQGAYEREQQREIQRSAEETAVPETSPADADSSDAGSSSNSSDSDSSDSGTSSSGSGSSSSGSGSSSSGGSSSGSGSSSSGSSSSGGSSSGSGSTGSASSSAVAKAIAAARSQLGVAYSWGGGGSSGPSYGITPDEDVYGFDCSGLTEYAYARAGIAIGGTSRDQWWINRSKKVGAGSLQAGDLLFWASGSSYTSIYHVAIYIGGGQMIEAPDRGLTVRISSLRYGSDYWGAVRPSA